MLRFVEYKTVSSILKSSSNFPHLAPAICWDLVMGDDSSSDATDRIAALNSEVLNLILIFSHLAVLDNSFLASSPSVLLVSVR